MKLFITFYLLLTNVCLAAESCNVTKVDILDKKDVNTETPKHLKGATLIIRTADGKEQSVSAESFKIVPRKQQFITTHTIQKVSCSPTIIEKVVKSEPLKNRASVMVGRGTNSGLTREDYLDHVDVSSKVGGVLGVQYQRLFTDRVSGSVQLQTNDTALIGVGLDF